MTSTPQNPKPRLQLVVPGSPSALLRGTHVLLVRFESVKPAPWQDDPEGGIKRTLEAEIKIEEIAKGAVHDPVGSVFKTTLTQYGTGSTRIAAVPGVWSAFKDIPPGERFVTVSVTGSESAAEIVRDPACVGTARAEGTIDDVHLAEQVEDQHLDVTGAAALAKASAPKVGGLFADYLWARFSTVALAQDDKLAPITDLLTTPGLANAARSTLISRLTTGLTSADPPPEKQLDRHAVALFHLLAMAEAEGFHDNLVGTYLPTVLDTASKDARPPAKVFEDYPGEKAKALAAVNAYHGPEDKAPLVAWLHR